MMMRIRISKTAEVPDEVVEEVLTEYTDWLDENKMLKVPEAQEDDENREFAQMFIKHRNAIVR
jgi:hypothetical protein